MADKLELFAKKHIDGHAPGIRGKEVQHTVLPVWKTIMSVLPLRKCSINSVPDCISMCARKWCKEFRDTDQNNVRCGVCLDRCAFCTDDKHVEEIRKEGHISTVIRKAIALGVPVAKAYKMGSYQAAEFYGLKNYGAIGAGYRADIVFLDDLEQSDRLMS